MGSDCFTSAVAGAGWVWNTVQKMKQDMNMRLFLICTRKTNINSQLRNRYIITNDLIPGFQNGQTKPDPTEYPDEE